ncbi:MAG: trypsin-like peptidase domain-containing protein [Lachnospiraceae bacterium]|nr:trypsin-like peptidase domain-containing protein [Lachnospiraceae bacterium]
MYDDLNNNDTTGRNYNDTGSSYTHYNSSDAMNQPKKKKKKGGFGRTVAKCLVLAVLFGSVSSAAFMGVNYLGHQYLGDAVSAQVDTDTAGTEIDSGESAVASTTTGSAGSDVYDVSDIVENCMSSVVSITNVSTTEFRTMFGSYSQQSSSSGSGIIIGQNDKELLIVTNNHVITGADEISVYFNSDGEEADESNVFSALVKGTDTSKDLAVIEVNLSDIPEETLATIKIATIGDSSSLKVGEPVVAIGNAYGYGLSVTSGIVSALNREVTLESDGQTITSKLIQTDAAINPGNSGGALLDAKGELIGINSAKFVSEDVEGMGYAIPISDVEEIINELMDIEIRDKVDESDQGYLGISDLVDVTTDVSESYNMPTGIYVRTVIDGLGADAAGMEAGDIITKLGGVTVSGYSELKEQLTYYAAGETVEVIVQRMENSSYTEKTLQVTLCTEAEVNAAQKE